MQLLENKLYCVSQTYRVLITASGFYPGEWGFSTVRMCEQGCTGYSVIPSFFYHKTILRISFALCLGFENQSSVSPLALMTEEETNRKVNSLAILVA